jgi:hypothetical protein
MPGRVDAAHSCHDHLVYNDGLTLPLEEALIAVAYVEIAPPSSAAPLALAVAALSDGR